MTITIDDGTFLIGNSFVTVLMADAFHEARQNTAWFAASEAQKEAALIKAFDYLSVQNWTSTAFSTEIPLKIKNAQCIGALKELEEAGALQPDVNPNIKMESIDGVMETEYFEGSGSAIIPTAVMNMIKPYLKRPGMNMTMVRG
jgi:hypothetical protein